MILATLKTYSGFDLETLENLEPAKTETFLFCDRAEYFSATFSPEVETVYILEFNVYGYTYNERKEYLRFLAKEFQNNFPDFVGVSYYEIQQIQSFFAERGKKYGLLKEFRENGIC